MTRPPKTAAQARGAARAVERKAVRRYMSPNGYESFDALNEWYCRAIFEQERTGPAPKLFYSHYARHVATRLGIPVPDGALPL